MSSRLPEDAARVARRAAHRRMPRSAQLSLLEIQIGEAATMAATDVQTAAAQHGVVLSADLAALLATRAILTYERLMQAGELAR